MAIEINKRKFNRSDDGLVVFSLEFHCETEDEALFEIPNLYRGLVLFGTDGGQWTGSEWTVKAKYRGLASAGLEPTELDQYSIEGDWREEPIEAFPNRKLLVDAYGAYVEDGKLKFPEKLPSTAEAVSQALGTAFGFAIGMALQEINGTANDGEENPMFGVTSYPVFYDVAEHRYVRSTLPSGLSRKAGTVVSSLPEGFEYDGDAVNWLVDKPTRYKRGNAWSIVERYKEVDEVKHLKALADLLQQGKSS